VDVTADVEQSVDYWYVKIEKDPVINVFITSHSTDGHFLSCSFHRWSS